MLLAIVLRLHSMEGQECALTLDLLETVSSVLCMVLREGIPGQVRE